jgi:hypothetical protein
VAGQVVYAGSDDGYLYAIDITSGRPRWRYRTGGPVRSRILVEGGVVYFGSSDRRVYALRVLQDRSRQLIARLIRAPRLFRGPIMHRIDHQARIHHVPGGLAYRGA